MTNSTEHTDTVAVTQAPSEREQFLIDLLRDRIQFHIWADATKEDVVSVIDGLNEADAFDAHVAALVQLPKGVTASEAQEAVDREFARHRLASEAKASEPDAVLEEVVLTSPSGPYTMSEAAREKIARLRSKPSATGHVRFGAGSTGAWIETDSGITVSTHMLNVAIDTTPQCSDLLRAFAEVLPRYVAALKYTPSDAVLDREAVRSMDESGSPESVGCIAQAWIGERGQEAAGIYGAERVEIVYEPAKALILYVDRKPHHVATTWRDPMNFAQLVRWSATVGNPPVATPSPSGDVDDVTRLRGLLNGRDTFIAQRGLWSDFVDSLPCTALETGNLSDEGER